MWFITWFFKKSKEERYQELLGLFEKLKKSGTLTTAELEKIIKRQPSLVNEVIRELFLLENDFEKLLDLQQEFYRAGSGYYGNFGALTASKKIAEKLIDSSFGKDLYGIFGGLFFPELREKAARKILQEENIDIVPTKTLGEIVLHVDPGDLKAKAAEEILKRELSDLESYCLVWIIAYVGSPQRERAYNAMVKRENWKDNLLLLFNMSKNPDNILFIEKAVKDFLRTNDDEDVQDILFSIVEHVKGDIGKKAAERLLSLLLNQSSWGKLSDLIWKCEEYPDLRERAVNEILKREKECSDGEIFCCIIRYIPSPQLKRKAAEVILDRFLVSANLRLVMKNVPSLKKQAKEMLEEIELVESEKPKRMIERILDFKI